jgi:amino acid transporter
MNEEKDEGVEVKLRRDLGLFDITMIGVGAMVGAGIFVLTGIGTGVAGPGIILAFVLNGVVTLFTAMTYAELSSAIPEAGGGYLWVKKTMGKTAGFMCGWMSWFGHTIACSLYALAFGHYLRWLLEEYRVSLFGISHDLLAIIFAILIIVIFIAINYWGVESTGKTEGFITIAKLVILGVFIAFGIWAMLQKPDPWDNFVPFLNPKYGFSGVIFAMGLTFIAFEGYEIIAQTGEEVKNPKKTLPKAIFISLAVVITIYVLVAIVALGNIPWEVLAKEREMAIVVAAKRFIPAFGGPIILVGGFFSAMSALNATIFSSSRVSFAMGRDRVLPSMLGRVHKNRRVPHNAIIISGIIIITMVFLPIEAVAVSADVLFLLMFLFVNIAVIILREREPDLDRGYTMPWYPWIPIIGIITKLILAVYMFNYISELGVNIGHISWAIAIIWIEVGALLYFAYRGRREIEKKEEFKPIIGLIPKISKERYHVLLPIADMKDAKLVEFSALVSKVEDANMTLLNIIEIPRALPIDAIGFREVNEKMKAMEQLKKICKKESVKARAKVTISHTIAETIIDEVKDEHINLLVLGWRGYRTRGRMMGTNIDYIAQNAPCDVAVFRTKGFEKLEKIMVLK